MRRLLLLLILPSLALAQSWPTQPVRVMVGFPPGGTTDVIGRLVANELSEQLGKPFVVENRGGASGTIGAGVVAKSAPDGHSLILVPSTHGTARALYVSLPYEESDFVAIGLVASTPYVFVAHPDFPAKSFGELIKLLKANPGKYNYASTSPGTAQHLGGELVKKMAGVDMVHIAYKGTGAVMPDLLSGRVPMMFENLAVMTPHIRKGSLRPLAVSSLKRTHLMPEVPTVAETGMGLEGFEVLGWFALLAPAKTPPPIVQLLNAELNKMIAKPQIVAKFAELGAEPLDGAPERARVFIKLEQDKWGQIIREVGIKIN
ncbi:MAG TPA: tripartite tricarboxylate transporter substrate binding protein [Burkholderiales bacterium]|nr:tripartite tricarboxylate transporter substrate binding protein [Burkholderiales bacterium]